MKPSDIVTNSYTAANNPETENLVQATPEELLHIRRKETVLELYPGCVVTEDPVLDAENMRLIVKLAYTHFDKDCHGCEQHRFQLREWGERTIKDVPLGAFKVSLKIKIPNVYCPWCGKTKWLNPPFKHPHHRITMRLYGQILNLLDLGVSHIDLKKIGQILGVEADIVRAIDKARLKLWFKSIPLENVKYIAIDEISVRKHHDYITVIIDAQTRRLLFATHGRKKDDLKPFFEKLKQLGLIDNILGAVMDGNCGYQNLVKELCPKAKIVLDLFHCIQLYNREVADAVRLAQIKKLRQDLANLDDDDKEGKERLLKQISDLRQSKWLSYVGRTRLEAAKESNVNLKELIMNNLPLLQVEIFSDGIRELWKHVKSPEMVRIAIENYCTQAKESGIEQIIKFSEKLKSWTEYIIHAATTGLNTSILEGCNNKFKVIKRVAYGFRDLEYYILKLHQALSVDRESTLKACTL